MVEPTSSSLARFVVLHDTPAWLSYGLTIIFVALFLLLKMVLSEDLAGRGFLLLVPPVFASALAFGTRQGMLAMVLGILGAGWFWLEPIRSFRIDDPDDLLVSAIFLGLCLSLIATTEALRRSWRALFAASDERRLLLQEFSHRLRNDFQAISSMLMIARQQGAGAVDDAMRRIAVLGRVYDRLSYKEQKTSVRAEDFVTGLVADLRHAMIGSRPIVVTTDVEPMALGISQATALGLAINELLTNALKYAFPDGRRGHVTVHLKRDNGWAVLTVQDTGIGFDPSAAPQGTGMGRLLVEQLVAQNGGTVSMESKDGVQAVVRLPLQLE